MKPLTLALLSSGALAALAMPASAQAQVSISSLLECDDTGEGAAAPATVSEEWWQLSNVPIAAAPVPGASPTPTPSPTPGTVYGPSNPVVQPIPTPTPAPASVVTPTPAPASSAYVTKPNTKAAAVTSKVVDGVKVTYYRGTYTKGYSTQNLAAKKSYSAPTSGTIKTVSGQKVQVSSSSVDLSKLHSSMINIIDELHLTAAALGYGKPIITSGSEGRHSTGSLHGSGKALDIRCNVNNGMSDSQCIAWAMTLKQALGPGYDVLYEDWNSANNHIHIEYDGSA